MTARPIQMLLVEDNPSDAELVLESLAKDGLAEAIHVAHDGVEALDFALCRGDYAHRAYQPRLRVVVLDVKLPRVDGFEVLRALKAEPDTKTIPVVMLTSSNIERDIALAYQLGANSYLQKPVDFEQFRQTVRHLGLYWLNLNEPPPIAAEKKVHP